MPDAAATAPYAPQTDRDSEAVAAWNLGCDPRSLIGSCGALRW